MVMHMRDALGLSMPPPDNRLVLPEVTTRQSGECRNCGQALYRYAGKRTGIGGWWHVAQRQCRRPQPVDGEAAG